MPIRLNHNFLFQYIAFILLVWTAALNIASAAPAPAPAPVPIPIPVPQRPNTRPTSSAIANTTVPTTALASTITNATPSSAVSLTATVRSTTNKTKIGAGTTSNTTLSTPFKVMNETLVSNATRSAAASLTALNGTITNIATVFSASSLMTNSTTAGTTLATNATRSATASLTVMNGTATGTTPSGGASNETFSASSKSSRAGINGTLSIFGNSTLPTGIQTASGSPLPLFSNSTSSLADTTNTTSVSMSSPMPGCISGTNSSISTNVSKIIAEEYTIKQYYPSIDGGMIASNGDGWAEAYKKARQFVSNLSIAEKVNLTSGIGTSGRCNGESGTIGSQNMWGICYQDGPLGVRSVDKVTAFPAGIAAASTWNKALIHQRGREIGEQFKMKGVDVALGLVGPLGSAALGGRNWESSGADPYLSGIVGAETVRGMQEANVIACGKHYIMNEQETNRYTISSNLGQRALRELYVRPFADMVRAGIGSIMSSYNQINNTYESENSFTLNRVLKDELGFQGFAVSAWGGVHNGIASFTSGNDVEMPGSNLYNSGLLSSILNGTVPVSRLDDMATRVMAAYYKVGLDKARKQRGKPNFHSTTAKTFDYLYPEAKKGPIVQQNYHVDVQTPMSASAAYGTAQEAIILLKNVNNTLIILKVFQFLVKQQVTIQTDQYVEAHLVVLQWFLKIKLMVQLD